MDFLLVLFGVAVAIFVVWPFALQCRAKDLKKKGSGNHD